MNNALEKGIKILNYALKNKTSINQACISHGTDDRSIRKLRANYQNKSESDYISFIKLYNEVLGVKTTSTKNSTLDSINDVQSDEELGLLDSDTVIKKESFKQISKGDLLELDYRGNTHVKTVDQLLETAEIDLNTWKVEREVVNKWDVTMKLKKELKDEEGNNLLCENGKPILVQEPATLQNFQVKVFLAKRRTGNEQTAFDEFLKSIRDNAPKFNISSQDSRKSSLHSLNKKYLLELSLPDLHIGKLSWDEESGENYDTKIAIQRYNDSVAKLLDHVRHYKGEIDEILLPIGNDLFNVDNKNNMTTAGTPQHVDSRWQQMFYKAKELKIKNINALMQIAPVKVVMVSGNHDQQTVFYLGSVLEAYYRNTNRVNVDNTPMQRKYHDYGINFIGFTHGNEEKHQDLGLIMATEEPQR